MGDQRWDTRELRVLNGSQNHFSSDSSISVATRRCSEVGKSPLRGSQSEQRQSLRAQGTDPERNPCVLAALFPEKSPAAPQTTKSSDDFATDSEDDGAKQNGGMNGEESGRGDVSRAEHNKRGKVGAALRVQRGTGILPCRCLS